MEFGRMRQVKSGGRLLGGLLAFAGVASGALAVEPLWRVQTDGGAAREVFPQSLYALPDGRLLVNGLLDRGASIDSVRDRVMLRLSADLSIDAALRPSQDLGLYDSAAGHRDSARGVLFQLPRYGLRYEPGACEQDRQLALELRSVENPENFGFGLPHARYRSSPLDLDGGLYLTYLDPQVYLLQRVVRYGRDCRRQLLPGPLAQPQGVPNANAVYAIQYRSTGDGQSESELVRFEHGSERWRLRGEAADRTTFGLFPAARNGDALFVRGVVTPDDWRSTIERWTAQGTPRWVRPARTRVRDLIDRGGDTLVVEGGAGAEQVQWLDADGSPRSEAALAPATYLGVLDELNSAAPPLLVLQPPAPEGQEATRVQEVGPQGLGASLALPSRVRPLLRHTDGSLLTLAAPEPHLTDRSRDLAFRLEQRWLGREDVRPLPLSTAIPHRAGGLLLDGDDVFLAALAADGTTRVYRYDTRGRPVWARTLPGLPALEQLDLAGPVTMRYALAANTTHLCLWRQHLGFGAITCLRRGDAHVEFGWKSFARYGDEAELRLDAQRVYALGELCVPAPGGGLCERQAERLVMRLDGEDLVRQRLGVRMVRAVAAPDQQAAALFEQHAERDWLAVFAADGTLRWRAPVERAPRALQLNAAGELLVASTERLERYAADGRRLWQRTLPADIEVDRIVPLTGGDAMLFGASYGGRLAYRARFAADGTPRWEISETQAGRRRAGARQVRVSEEAGLFLLRRAPDALEARWTLHRLSDGVAVGGLAHPVNGPFAAAAADPAHAMAIDAHGNVVLARERREGTELLVEKWRREDLVAGAAQPPDASLLGFWYAPDSTGQGFYLAHDATSGNAFGSWYTFAGTGGHDPAALRWYVFTAPASAAAEALEFELRRNSGGEFARGPATASEVIGRATLRRIGCDAALFSYRFEPGVEGGAAGAIPLARLTGTPACGAPADAASRRSRSGAWYVPAQSGQGLMFDFSPPQGGAAGAVAGAWFTYDAVADDPTRQHWFTLAGASSTERDAELVIYRTLGGALDGTPTRNTFAVGTARLRYLGCDTAELEYRFDGSEFAHDHADLRATLALRRIGGCAVP
jgi:hypothetical protein